MQPQKDALRTSDSEGSCSNVQTVITTRQGWDGPKQSGVAAGVDQWVETTQSSLRLQGKLILEMFFYILSN